MEDNNGLIDYCSKQFNSKRISKLKLEKLLSILTKHLTDTSNKQTDLEEKVECLGKQNEEFVLQNQQIMEEIVNKKYININLVIIQKN